MKLQSSATPLTLLFLGKNGKSFCEKLLDYNYQGLSFTTIQKAVDWLDKQKETFSVPFAIISDLQLPDGNAFDLCKRTQSDPLLKDILFVVVARNFVPANDERARELGIDAYFPYPPMGRVMHHKLVALHQEKIRQVSIQATDQQGEAGFLSMIRKLVTPEQR